MKNDKKNPFFSNAGLFSTSFFLNRVEREKDFPKRDAEDVRSLWETLKKHWTKHEARLTSKRVTESDTEKFLFDFLLPQLGFSIVSKTQLKGVRGNSKFPDYTLFPSEEAATSAINADVEYRYRQAIGILEAKRFSLPLDQLEDSDAGGSNIPCVQITEYLRDAELDWGILSNGEKWQIFSRRGRYSANRFFEINLIDMLNHSEMPNEFCIFLYCFSQSAFLKDKDGACRLDRILDQSRKYSQEVGAPFYLGCTKAIRLIFEEYQRRRKAQRSVFESQRCHQAALILLFRIIAIRYLEDRGVLPTLSGEYRSISLDVIRIKIERDIREGKKPLANGTGLWQRLRILFQDVNSGKFGVYPGHKGFESDLFDIDFDAFYRDNPLTDPTLSKVIDWVCRGDGGSLGQIDFFDLGIEKIGDVYNELLGLRVVRDEAGKVLLASSETRKKELGSYFTHPRLTKLISDGALKYLREKYQSRSEWLKITFCDNSCGSGHFIRQLVEDISYELYVSPQNRPTESQKPLDQNAFRRMLAQHSAFGIDKDINAVWLTKLSLWLQTAEAGKPFVFLDSHIVHGDSVLSTTEAPILNSADKSELANLAKRLAAAHSEDRDAIQQARAHSHRIKNVLRKYRKYLRPQKSLFEAKKEDRGTYFSYALAFPEVFLPLLSTQVGFTIIVGNPPWETVKPKLQDFYKMKTGREVPPKRKELDAWLQASPSLSNENERWSSEVRNYARAIKDSGYRHQAGEVSTYAYFTERALQTLQAGGLLSYIVKLGIYGDHSTAQLRKHLFKENTLKRMWLFKSNTIDGLKLFPKIDSNEKFAVFDVEKRRSEEYAFEAKQVVTMDDISRDFPDWATYEIPKAIGENTIVEVYDTDVRKSVAAKVGKFRTLKACGLIVSSELHLTADRKLFSQKKGSTPIYTGHEVKPFRLSEPTTWCKDGGATLATIATASVRRIGVNDIIPNSRRKLKASIVPAGSLSANSVLIINGFLDETQFLTCLAALNSLVVEYVLRPKLSNMHLNNFRLEALPMPEDFGLGIREEIAKVTSRILRKDTISEMDECFVRIEALLAVGFGLMNSEIRSYICSFSDTSLDFANEVIDFAEIYRDVFARKPARSS